MKVLRRGSRLEWQVDAGFFLKHFHFLFQFCERCAKHIDKKARYKETGDYKIDH